jgi:hypothetical protein
MRRIENRPWPSDVARVSPVRGYLRLALATGRPATSTTVPDASVVGASTQSPRSLKAPIGCVRTLESNLSPGALTTMRLRSRLAERGLHSATPSAPDIAAREIVKLSSAPNWSTAISAPSTGRPSLSTNRARRRAGSDATSSILADPPRLTAETGPAEAPSYSTRASSPRSTKRKLPSSLVRAHETATPAPFASSATARTSLRGIGRPSPSTSRPSSGADRSSATTPPRARADVAKPDARTRTRSEASVNGTIASPFFPVVPDVPGQSPARRAAACLATATTSAPSTGFPPTAVTTLIRQLPATSTRGAGSSSSQTRGGHDGPATRTEVSNRGGPAPSRPSSSVVASPATSRPPSAARRNAMLRASDRPAVGEAQDGRRCRRLQRRACAGEQHRGGRQHEPAVSTASCQPEASMVRLTWRAP